MVTTQNGVPRLIRDIGFSMQNQLFNLSKENHGRTIRSGQQVYLNTDTGAWFVTRIVSLTWIGPMALVVVGSIAKDRSEDEEGFQVRIELDLRDTQLNGEIEPMHDQIRLSSQTREYFARFASA